MCASKSVVQLRGASVQAHALVRLLQDKGVTFWVDGGQLRYRAPAGALGKEDIKLLREQRTSIVALLSERASAGEMLPVPEANTRFSPLSFQQEWFWKAIESDRSWNYFVHSTLKLTGYLDLGALREGINVVRRRHDTLRTRIIVEGGRPAQCVDELSECPLELVRVCANSRGSAEVCARELIENTLRLRLDVAAGPLFVAKLFELSGKDYVLLVAVHHILIDAMSFTQIFKEVWAVYRDVHCDRESSLRPAGMQFTDYAAQQRRGGHEWRAGIARYWAQKLDGALRIHWPRDAQPDGVSSGPPATFHVEFGSALTSQLRDVAARGRVTLSMLVMASLCKIICQHCRQRDFVLPFVFNGRHHQEHLDVVGFLIYPMPLRIRMSGSEPLLQLARGLSREFVAASEHADFGIYLTERSDLMSGMFTQWISWQPDEINGVPSGEEWRECAEALSIEPFPVTAQTPENAKTNIDMATFFEDRRDGICVEIMYRADVFTGARIEQLWEEVRRVCASAAAELVNST
jgi:condensation domain-containing protein/tubulysin polyketide synthase-like protein